MNQGLKDQEKQRYLRGKLITFLGRKKRCHSWSQVMVAVLSVTAVLGHGNENELPEVIGTARDGNGTLQYTEFHRYESGRHRVEYLLPDGRTLAHKNIEYQPQPGLVNFSLFYPSLPRREQIQIMDGEVVINISGSRVEKSHRLIHRSNDIIDAGFDPFVRSHWNALSQGKRVSGRFLLLERGRWLNMSIKRIDSLQCNGAGTEKVALCLNIRPSSLLIALFAPRLVMGYDEGQRLVVYEGPSNLLIEEMQPLKVTISYQYH